MNRRSFSREAPELRRQELIDATLEVIGEAGFAAATVRAISERADVTQGLIRHYFQTKEELVSAAYEHHMDAMTEQALAPAQEPETSALEKLRDVVVRSVSPDVLSERNLTLWASFISKVHTASEIKETHERTYLWFRNGLEDLITEALTEAEIDFIPGEIRKRAIMCNAVIDGLWIEGAAMPSEFDEGDVQSLALQSVGAILNLPLSEKN